jgi:hypothetical protein
MPERSKPDNGQPISTQSRGDLQVAQALACSFITHDETSNINMPAALEDIAKAIGLFDPDNADGYDPASGEPIYNRHRPCVVEGLYRIAEAGQSIANAINRLAEVLAER